MRKPTRGPWPRCILAALMAAAVAGCDGGAPGGRPPAETRPSGGREPIAVRIARVEAGRAPRIVRAMGSFEAEDVVTIGAKVSGRIVAVGPEVGDKVSGGASLVRIEEVDYVLARDQRARVLEESLAKLGLEKLPEGDVDFERLPLVESARLEAANEKARYDRGVSLHSRTPPLISDQDLADLKLAWDVAVSGHKAALLTARTDLAQARTRRTELEAAEQRMRDTRYAAPEGTARWLVGERRVSVGNYVAVGAPLYRLVDADPLRLVVRVPERRMAGIVPGKEAAVRIAEESTPLAAHVTRLRPEVDPRTRTHEVEIEVRNPELALSVGGFAIAEIRVGEDTGVPMVPSSAVVNFAGVRKVFVPDKDRAGERLIVTGRRIGDRVEILEGLAAGDVYIADPSPALVPGAPIRILGGLADAEAR